MIFNQQCTSELCCREHSTNPNLLYDIQKLDFKLLVDQQTFNKVQIIFKEFYLISCIVVILLCFRSFLRIQTHDTVLCVTVQLKNDQDCACCGLSLINVFFVGFKTSMEALQDGVCIWHFAKNLFWIAIITDWRWNKISKYNVIMRLSF